MEWREIENELSHNNDFAVQCELGSHRRELTIREDFLRITRTQRYSIPLNSRPRRNLQGDCLNSNLLDYINTDPLRSGLTTHRDTHAARVESQYCQRRQCRHQFHISGGPGLYRSCSQQRARHLPCPTCKSVGWQCKMDFRLGRWS